MLVWHDEDDSFECSASLPGISVVNSLSKTFPITGPFAGGMILRQSVWVVTYLNPNHKALPTSSIVRQRESRWPREYLKAYSQGACVSDIDSVRDQIKSNRKHYKQQRDTLNSTVISVKRILKCSICHLTGHNKRSCVRFWKSYQS